MMSPTGPGRSTLRPPSFRHVTELVYLLSAEHDAAQLRANSGRSVGAAVGRTTTLSGRSAHLENECLNVRCWSRLNDAGLWSPE